MMTKLSKFYCEECGKHTDGKPKEYNETGPVCDYCTDAHSMDAQQARRVASDYYRLAEGLTEIVDRLDRDVMMAKERGNLTEHQTAMMMVKESLRQRLYGKMSTAGIREW